MTKLFEIFYETHSEMSISIEADSVEDAHEIWNLGDHSEEKTIAEYLSGDTIQIDGVVYQREKFIKVENDE